MRFNAFLEFYLKKTFPTHKGISSTKYKEDELEQ
jgi:hypothetical protein